MSEEQINAVEMEETEQKGEKGGAKGAKKKTESVVMDKKGKVLDAHIDSEPKVLLEWAQKGGSIAFDPGDLPKLSEEELNSFPYSTVRAYKAAVERAEKSAVKIEVLDTLGGDAGTKLKLRKRRGYHQTWKRPDELDAALEVGYVVIRESKDPNKPQEPGKETGPIKRIGKEDKAELIAMEVSQERYDNHVKAMTKKSRRAYQANKERFAGNVEQFNRNLPKNDRMRVVDDEGDVG